jgi:hypothetical protein
MVRRSFASRFSESEETVCANVSGLFMKLALLATMESAHGCPKKWVELEVLIPTQVSATSDGTANQSIDL